MTLILSGSDGVSDVDGSASTPALRGTDTNTGIFFPAADTIAFAEGGSEIARFDSSGNFGIGITPSYKLDVNASANGTQLRLYNTVVSNTTQNTIDFWYLDSGGTPYNNGRISNTSTNSAGEGNLRFYTRPQSGSLTEQASINSTGVLSFNSGYGSSAAAYGCRAWVCWNGTGTPAIRAAGNVTSITDNGTGDFTVNFTNAMPDTNFGTSGMTCNDVVGGSSQCVITEKDTGVRTTSSVRVYTGIGSSRYDFPFNSVAIHR